MIEETNGWDELCNIFILVMENLSRETGLSYGLLNILMFCVIGPLATCCFIASTASAYFIKKPVKRK